MISFIAKKQGKLSKLALESFDTLSYSLLFKLLRNKDVKVNQKRVNKDLSLEIGDEVVLYVDLTKELSAGYKVIYLDPNVIVINKKSGYTAESVYQNLLSLYSEVYFIHRLDRNTSGIMIFALNKQSEECLINGFKFRTFIKKYKALVVGIPPKKHDVLEGYLFKDAKKAIVKVYDKHVLGSQKIVTEYKVLENFGDRSLLEVILHTGRTHQIRAHLAYVGNPVCGDGKYGDNEFNRQNKYKFQQLCAYKLKLNFESQSPLFYLNGKEFEFQADF